MEVVAIIIGIVVGLVTSFIFTRILGTTHGVLKIDHSNPDKELYRFEIDDLSSLSKKTRIILNIDHDADLSQK